ncbi:protein DpdF [Actinoplanes sp. NPDC051513]|uniref:protein DpdF n=1 Tax=Actinoplanes sp. NPDC051513 TaxID=3363908 RepID=UPI00379DEA99
MPADNLTTAQRLLDGGQVADVVGTCRRLRDALAGIGDMTPAWRDVAALVRQVILEQQAHTGTTMHLRAPLRVGLPTVAQWMEAGCIRLGQDADSVTIAARPWWPRSDDGEDPTLVARELTDVYRRRAFQLSAVAADPFWTATLGHDSYLSLGQRQAARAVILAPPGTTTLVCLPTGQGKTDVVLAPILAAADQPGVSVVVVPTVALALDMERRVRDVIARMGHQGSPSGCYAYLGGMPDELKIPMREAIRNGQQKVVFAAPESVVRGIGAALTVAASCGYLRYIVIDEAHLVEQWGTEFRPDFQALATQRSEWDSVAPTGRRPATVTMSATLTDDQIRYLTDLLPGRETAVVWASALRPEPSYFIRRFTNVHDRDESVLEAVSYLPRPLALYVTRRDDVRHWVAMLNRSGLRRVGQITGASTDTQRRAVIDGWRGGDGTQPTLYDVVVGTSAFGLGIDMPDVRAVVHACLPETVDRFYQEVGRAGRDGAASLSFLAIAPSDEPMARRLNRKKIIKPDKGWRRWRRMVTNSEVEPHLHRVDLDWFPAHMDEGFDQNRAWNVRILNLMARSGLVRLKPSPPAGGESIDPDEEFGGNMVDVEVITGEAMSKDSWSARIDSQRQVIQGAERRAFAAIQAAASGGQCMGSVLSGYYTATWSGGRLTTEINCRGCPHCRSHRTPLGSGLYRQGLDPHPAVHAWYTRPPDPLKRARARSPMLAITWRTARERHDRVPDLLVRLARRGMSVVGGPGFLGDLAGQLQRDASPFPVIVDTDRDLLRTYDGPIIWLLGGRREIDAEVRERLQADGITYLVHWEPSIEFDASPAQRSYDDIPTLSVAIALGAL